MFFYVNEIKIKCYVYFLKIKYVYVCYNID